jgi:polar amino acid transport system substrate-binding protein
MTTRLSRPRAAALASSLTAALLLTGCGAVVDDEPSADAGSGSSSDAPLFDQLPADVQEAGKLTVASSGTYPPMNFFDTDGKTIVGFQPELADAIGEQLGVEVEFVVANFDAVLAGIESGRYDTAMMTMSDTEERREKVHFVDYGSAGSSIVVAGDNPEGITGMDDLCGLTVSTVTGYLQVDQLEAQSEVCTGAGNDAIDIQQFPQQVNADQAVATGRAQAQLGDTITSAYSVENSDGKLELIDTVIEPAPFGMPFTKDRTELVEAMQQAVQAIIDNGDYAEAAANYGLESVMPEQATINAGKGL